jgi:hypothetical protein
MSRKRCAFPKMHSHKYHVASSSSSSYFIPLVISFRVPRYSTTTTTSRSSTVVVVIVVVGAAAAAAAAAVQQQNLQFEPKDTTRKRLLFEVLSGRLNVEC